MVDILPSTLQKDVKEIEKRMRLIAGIVDWAHVDVADNTLVPNQTFTDFANFPVIPTGLQLEAHLMVEHPEKYIKPLVDAGFSRIIAQIECADPRYFLEEAQYEQVEVGFSIDGPSEFDLIEPFLHEVDTILVMTIEAGFSGQEFMPETLDKVRSVKEITPQMPVSVDGGINDKSARIAIEAGVDRLVSASFVFQKLDHDSIRKAIADLRKFEGNIVSTGKLDDGE